MAPQPVGRSSGRRSRVVAMVWRDWLLSRARRKKRGSQGPTPSFSLKSLVLTFNISIGQRPTQGMWHMAVCRWLTRLVRRVASGFGGKLPRMTWLMTAPLRLRACFVPEQIEELFRLAVSVQTLRPGVFNLISSTICGRRNIVRRKCSIISISFVNASLSISRPRWADALPASKTT